MLQCLMNLMKLIIFIVLFINTIAVYIYQDVDLPLAILTAVLGTMLFFPILWVEMTVVFAVLLTIDAFLNKRDKFVCRLMDSD